MDKTLNVFVLDRQGVAIPGATVTFSYKREAISQVTTVGKRSRPVRVQLNPAYEFVTVRAKYRKYSKEATVDLNSGYELVFEEVTMPRTNVALAAVGVLIVLTLLALVGFGMRSITGAQQAPWIFGAVFIGFFMALLWFKPKEQFGGPQARLLRVLAAVFVGLIAAFFSGSLHLGGKVPFFSDLAVESAGGIRRLFHDLFHMGKTKGGRLAQIGYSPGHLKDWSASPEAKVDQQFRAPPAGRSE